MTIAAGISARDRAAFVGRREELAVIDVCLAAESPTSVVFVHGPGGIGKSALLRAAARRAGAAGRTVVAVDAGSLPPVPGALDDALAPARAAGDALVLIDGYEHAAALGPHLRQVVLPALPGRTAVVVAGRRAPERGWFAGGWEWVVRELELGPLPAADAGALLGTQGIRDPDDAARLVAWAAGSPLALTLAAGAVRAGEWRPSEAGEPDTVLRALVRHLVDGEDDPHHRDVLAVACLARVTTARLLGDVLPGVDAAAALAWLAGRTYAVAQADGLALHELVRRALRADLRAREPERERELRRRIADSLHARALAGDLLMTIDLADLVESPVLRALYSWQGAARHRVDRVREGDAAGVAAWLIAHGREGWWRLTEPFFAEAPETVIVARDRAGALCGYAIVVTPASAPGVADRDPMLGPWLRHARDLAPGGDAVLCRDAADFTDDPAAGIEAMIHVSTVLQAGLANPRYMYLPVVAARAEVAAFSAALPTTHLAALDAVPELDHVVAQCHLLDCGPGGLFELQRAIVYAELGFPPPPPPPPGSAPDGRRQAADPVDPAAVREALRNLHVPDRLARSPLATGDGTEARAASVQRLIADAADRAFGDSDDERLTRRALELGYLERTRGGHEQAARTLHLSRSAYFRRLRAACERLVDELASPG